MASEIKSDKLSPSTAQALQIGDASDTITIPTGATLTVVDGIPVASGGTGLASFTAGDILYATGSTTLAKLAKGTTLQTLKMNSGATAPEWATVTAGGNTPIVSVYNDADQTIANVTFEIIEFNTEIIDSDSAFAANRFTVPADKAGKYYMEFTFQQTWGGTTTTRAQFRKNGTGIMDNRFWNQTGSPEHSGSVAIIDDLSVSDYIECWLYTDQGGTITIDSSSEKETRLNIFYLGA